MNERLLEPLKYYEKMGKREHEQNVTAYFDDLLKKSKVNVEENRATTKKYYAETATIEKLRDKLFRKKVARVFLLITVIIGVILIIVGAYTFSSSRAWGIGLLAASALCIILPIILLKKKINPEIRQASEKIEEHERKAKLLREEAERQMQPLNALFDNTDTLRLIEKTLPDFAFDDYFTPRNEDFMLHEHDFVKTSSSKTSVIGTLSGRFAGNPFLYTDTRVFKMGTYTYHGTLVISWTERYRDDKGRMRTRLRTQTLYAQLTKPKPEYYTEKTLFYGSQAAPELSFSRVPKHSERLTEKQLQRKIKKGAKKLKRKAEKATQKGGHFQEMTNAEFDVLFGAENRNHEVQFRVMYTPLAQCNTVDLLTSKTGYGDDFHFHKQRRMNTIISEHAQGWAMDTSPARYYSFDVDKARKNFIGINTEYFKSLFFDFAPLLSIPAYVETPCASLESIEEYDGNYTSYEHEALANAMGAQQFAHPATATQSILKTRLLGKSGEEDRVAVTALSFAAENRIDFVPVLGGDGKVHPVPLENTAEICIQRVPASMLECQKLRNQGDTKLVGATCFHGMAGRLMSR